MAGKDFLKKNELKKMPGGRLAAQPKVGVTYRAPINGEFYSKLYSESLFAGVHLDSIVYAALIERFGCGRSF